MSMEYIRKTYGVPAKRGMIVDVYYRRWVPPSWAETNNTIWTIALSQGRITSASNYIHVNGIPFHPTYGVVYYGDGGAVLLDTRKGRVTDER